VELETEMAQQGEGEIALRTSQRDATADVLAEHDALAETICARLRDGSLPPDEAYWWTRILVEGAIACLSDLTGARSNGCVCEDCDCDCSRRTAQAA
jgi:hypothetical protein